MPRLRLPHSLARQPSGRIKRLTGGATPLTAVLVVVVALVGCATPPPQLPPDIDHFHLLITNYSDTRIQVMSAKDSAADLAASSAESFPDAGAASTVAVAWGPGDRIYVSDFALGQIRVYDADDAFESVAPTPVAIITSPTILEPYAMAFDEDGALWVTDLRGSRPLNPIANHIAKLTEIGGLTGTVSVTPDVVVTLDATTLAFGSTWLTSLYFDAQGDLWFTDTLDWAVSRISDPGSILIDVNGLVPDLRLQSINPGNANLSDIRNPIGIAVDTAGNLYVGNRGRDKVARFDGAASLAGDYVGTTRQADADLAVGLAGNTALVALAPDGALWVASSGPTDLAQLVRVTGQATGTGDVSLTPSKQFNWSSNTHAFHEAGGMLVHSR